MTTEEIYFELRNGDDFLRIEPIERIDYKSTSDYDKNWVKTKITAKGGAFSGQYVADIMTTDFERFKNELLRLYSELKGTTIFEDREHYLEIKMGGDGNGHIGFEVKAWDEPGTAGSILSYSLAFDQTEMKPLINQIDAITKLFPIIGDLKIKNS